MHRVDASGATAGNLFTNGDPVNAIPATRLEEAWHNDIQEEVCNTIEDAGITLVKGTQTQLRDSIIAISEREALHAIGEYIMLSDDLAGAKTLDVNRYIKLTKDLTGVGLYNENKLGGQATVVSGEQTFYTAIITDAASPMFGEVIKLINSTIDNNSGLTAPTVISASETSGLVRHNRVQGHRHGASYSSGSLPPAQILSVSYATTSSGSIGSIALTHDPITDTVNGTPRTGFTTEQNNVTATFYMRFK